MSPIRPIPAAGLRAASPPRVFWRGLRAAIPGRTSILPASPIKRQGKRRHRPPCSPPDAIPDRTGRIGLEHFSAACPVSPRARRIVHTVFALAPWAISLKNALTGGAQRGQVVEIYGPESSGKTTLTLQVIAEMQKEGGTCAFIDAEHALDVQYASKL